MNYWVITMTFEEDFPSLAGLHFAYDGCGNDAIDTYHIVKHCLDKSIVDKQYLSKQKVKEDINRFYEKRSSGLEYKNIAKEDLLKELGLEDEINND